MDAVPDATKKEDKASASGAGDDGRGGGGGGGGQRGRKRKFQSLNWVLLQVENLEGCHRLIRRAAMEITGVESVMVDEPNNQVMIIGPMATDPDLLVESLRRTSGNLVSVLSAPYSGHTYTPSSV
ncbi:hypothetical protein GUJ93_ZPchr0014g46600 [Zizania palustris]|uniref:HMA domain-containing protein n=1 Tax=Zizania palustris TaxID=103762 RepID=A0A8J5THC3_ZIZPA|nr:hypothetical protein GUJ93_ZPchr0014g46600 [Zizania palustris]